MRSSHIYSTQTCSPGVAFCYLLIPKGFTALNIPTCHLLLLNVLNHQFLKVEAYFGTHLIFWY